VLLNCESNGTADWGCCLPTRSISEQPICTRCACSRGRVASAREKAAFVSEPCWRDLTRFARFASLRPSRPGVAPRPDSDDDLFVRDGRRRALLHCHAATRPCTGQVLPPSRPASIHPKPRPGVFQVLFRRNFRKAFCPNVRLASCLLVRFHGQLPCALFGVSGPAPCLVGREANDDDGLVRIKTNSPIVVRCAH
jgi:hypothetical protein